MATAKSAIAYGTSDSTHTAVVALLADAGGGSFSECSGTIVQVKNSTAYILTAAHCCNMGAPTVVVMSNDYTTGEQYIGGGTPSAPSYAVVPGSVYYDDKYDMQHYDFCMLKVAGVSASTPVIPVAQPGQDGLAIGVSVEHVGFGVTDATMNNSGRRHGTNTVDQGIDTYTITSSQGGSSHTPGPCEGDSGGPTLVPAGASQAQQKVVATTSYGNNSTCVQDTLGVSMRVTSETGPSGFITNFLKDAPSGTQAGSTTTTGTCSSCEMSAQSGACASQANACGNDQSCLTLDTCLQNCTTQACATTCENAAGTAAVNELNAFSTCICNTACPSECSTQCGGTSSSSSSSSSSGGASCGLTTGMAACDSCITSSCCSQAQACANDASCTACLVQNPASTCGTNANLIALGTCLKGSCDAPCLGGTSTSASSSSSSAGGTTTGGTTTGNGSSSGSITTGTGAGNGAGGSSASGGETSGTGGGTVGQKSGCSVGDGGAGADPASGTSLAGLLLGAAVAFARRRRAS